MPESLDPFYITTAIAYPNGEPHIGHAYEYVATDAVARFKRLDGFDVRYLTGTDEHGLKVAQTAAAAGIPTAQLARRNSDVFEALQRTLNISFDRFIRTTDPDHYEARRPSGARWPITVTSIWTPTPAGTRCATRRTTPTRRRPWPRRHPHRHRDGDSGRLDRGAFLFLQALGVPGQAAGPLRGTSGVHRPRCAAQRGGQLRLRRAARPVHLTDHLRLGSAGPRQP